MTINTEKTYNSRLKERYTGEVNHKKYNKITAKLREIDRRYQTAKTLINQGFARVDWDKLTAKCDKLTAVYYGYYMYYIFLTRKVKTGTN